MRHAFSAACLALVMAPTIARADETRMRDPTLVMEGGVVMALGGLFAAPGIACLVAAATKSDGPKAAFQFDVGPSRDDLFRAGGTLFPLGVVGLGAGIALVAYGASEVPVKRMWWLTPGGVAVRF